MAELGKGIGIALGTKYSCVAVWQNDRVEVIAPDQGNRTTPSYIAFTDSERLIGDAVKNQVAMNLIGRPFADSYVQADMTHWPKMRETAEAVRLWKLTFSFGVRIKLVISPMRF